MVEPLFAPIPVQYRELYTVGPLVDASELGISLQGLARLTNGVVHFYLHGDVVKDSRLYRARVFAGSPRVGSTVFDLLALLVTGELPLYAPILREVGAVVVTHIVRAVIEMAIGDHGQAERAIDHIAELAKRHDEFAQSVHEGHMGDKRWLQDRIAQLAEQSRIPLQELAKPIGSSCREIDVGDATVAEPAVIDEAEAEVLTSKEKLQVREMQQFRGVMEAVDTINGSCKIRIEGSDEVLRGKITDPALSNPENVYTRSLDLQRFIVVSAKPILKEGKISTLFISDGHSLTDA
jgi:hypothetical protein